MSSTRLQRYALIAEIIGGAAIVVSLIFVGYQVKQSTKEAELNRRALELATYQSLTQNFEGLHDPLVNDHEFATIWEKSINSDLLTAVERRRLRAFAGRNFRHGDLAFNHFRQGSLNEETLNNFLEIVVARIDAHDVVAEGWENVKHRGFQPDYVAYMDALIAERTSE